MFKFIIIPAIFAAIGWGLALFANSHFALTESPALWALCGAAIWYIGMMIYYSGGCLLDIGDIFD